MPYPTQTLFFGNNPLKITDKSEVALSALSGEKDDREGNKNESGNAGGFPFGRGDAISGDEAGRDREKLPEHRRTVFGQSFLQGVGDPHGRAAQEHRKFGFKL